MLRRENHTWWNIFKQTECKVKDIFYSLCCKRFIKKNGQKKKISRNATHLNRRFLSQWKQIMVKKNIIRKPWIKKEYTVKPLLSELNGTKGNLDDPEFVNFNLLELIKKYKLINSIQAGIIFFKNLF